MSPSNLSISSVSNRFPLLDLPPETIALIGTFTTSHRLAFPTGAHNWHLKSIFGDPINIAARAIQHYPSPEEALVAESSIGDVEVLRALIPKADMDKVILMGDVTRCALSEAAKHGHLEAVRCLLDAGAEVDQNDGYPLTNACLYGHTLIVEVLVERGANLGKYGDACLRIASRAGRIAVVRFLLDRGVNHPHTLLQSVREAVERGHVDIIDLLVSRGGALDWTTSNCAVYMDIAAKNGRLDAVKYFVDHGVELGSLEGRPLILAAFFGHADIVRYLLDSGVDVHAQCEDALLKAAIGGSDEVVKVLLGRGARADQVRPMFLGNGGERSARALKLLDKCVNEMAGQVHGA